MFQQTEQSDGELIPLSPSYFPSCKQRSEARCLQMDPGCLGKRVAMKSLGSPGRCIRRVSFSRLDGVLSVVATLLPAKCLQILTG